MCYGFISLFEEAMQGEGTHPLKFPFPKPFLLPVFEFPLLFPAQADCHDQQSPQHSNFTVGKPQHPNGLNCQDISALMLEWRMS